MSEYTDLIREARKLPRADPGDVIDSLVGRLADALEASEAEMARLNGLISGTMLQIWNLRGDEPGAAWEMSKRLTRPNIAPDTTEGENR